MRHDEDGRRAGRRIGVGDAAAEQRRDSQKPEGVRRHQAGSELQCAVARREQRVFEPAADDVFEHLALFLIVEKLRHLKAGAPTRLAAAGIAYLDIGNAVDVGVRCGIQQNVLNDAEDGSGAADAERQREDGEQRERGTPDEPAHAVSNVLPDVADHGGPPLDERVHPKVGA